MKKIILSLVITSTVFVIACNKTELAPSTEATTTSTVSETSNPAVASKTKGSPYRLLFLSANKKICVCVSTGGNCLPDVVVTSSAAKIIESVIKSVNDGDQASIQQIFSDNRNELNDIMDNSDVVRVINGNLTVSTASSNDGSTKFLILSRFQDNEIEAGYPFIY